MEHDLLVSTQLLAFKEFKMFAGKPNLWGLLVSAVMLLAVGAASAAPMTFGKAGSSKEAGAADNAAASCTSGDCEVRNGPNSVGAYRASFENDADFIRNGYKLNPAAYEKFSMSQVRSDDGTNVTYKILSGAGNITTSMLCDDSVDPPECADTGFVDNDKSGRPFIPDANPNEFVGRWDTDKAGANTWFEFFQTLYIDLGAEYEVLGFYLTDLADTQGTAATVDVSIDGGVTWNALPETSSSPAGVLFFGIYEESGFQHVQLRVMQQSMEREAIDVAGLDQIVVGNLQRVGGGGNLPEPGSLALVGLSLLAAARIGRKRQH